MDLGISGRTTGAAKPASLRSTPPVRTGSSSRLVAAGSLGSVRSTSASSRSTASSRVSSGASDSVSRVMRPTEWSPEVEEAFRLQCAGWKSVEEYVLTKKCQPDRWEESGRIKKLSIKGTTHWNYFSRDRECTSSHIGKVKIYH